MSDNFNITIYRYVFLVSALLLGIYLFHPLLQILNPFFFGFLAAYALSNKIDILEQKLGIKRILAVFMVVASFLSLVVFLGFLLIPEIYSQASMIIYEIPQYEAYLQANIIPYLTTKISQINPIFAQNFSDAINNNLSILMSQMVHWSNNIVSYTISTISSIISILIFPIILFYLLLDWHKLDSLVYDMIPESYKSLYQQFGRDLSRLLAAYVRGQLYICLGVAIYYSVIFWFVGMPTPVLLGVCCGLMIVIPLLGAMISLCIIILTGYFAKIAYVKYFYILLAFCFAQIIEGNIITPKVIGEKIGIHPVGIMFLVLLFGNLFGAFGVLFAMPTSVLLRLIFQYVRILLSYKYEEKHG